MAAYISNTKARATRLMLRLSEQCLLSFAWAIAEGTINVPGNRLELNARMAASLDAPVLMVLDANKASGIDDLVNKALVSRNGLLEERAQVVGLIVNKASMSLAAGHPRCMLRSLLSSTMPAL